LSRFAGGSRCAAKGKSRKPARPQLVVELLEGRLTPCMGCNDVPLNHLLGVTSARVALAAPAAGAEQVVLEVDRTLHLAGGSAEQAASFKIEDVASLTLAPGLAHKAHSHQTEAGDTISIEPNSLLSRPGPGLGG
jgi:hypothetical protein